MSPDLKTLAIIREATRAMIDHASGHDRVSFQSERKSRSAVLFEIVIQGEGVKRLSLDLRNRHPTVPWAQIAGMRDRLVHSFDAIDFDIVWDVAHILAPSLLGELDGVIAQESKPYEHGFETPT
jgi:uncharacterized protein with HEPN domain